jgi:hypothetical protein
MTQGQCRGERLRTVITSGLAAALAVALAGVAGCTGAAQPSGVLGQPPTPGSITETVPAVTPPAPKELGLGDEATLDGLKVRVVSVSARDVESTVPTEGKGPALVFALSLRNDTATDYRTAQLEVGLLDSAGGAASRVTGAPAIPFPATVAPGAEATASYVFLIAQDVRKPVTLTVSAGAGSQPAQFRGNA